jgi:Domain of unknown function (DUF6249)
MDLMLSKQVFVPIVLFLCITFAFKALLDAITRYRMLKEGLSETLLAELLNHDARQRKLSSLRWGVFLIAIGLGFALIEAFGWNRPTPGSIALLAIVVGIGQLVTYRLTRNMT